MKRERTPMDYFELVETFPKRGCALCNLLRRDETRCIDGMVYGFMDTDEMREAFGQSRGLCNEHGWLLKQNKFGNVLGIAKLYAATIGEVLSIIESTPVQSDASAVRPSRLERLLNTERRGSAQPLADRLEPEGRCMVCERIDEREADYVQIIDQYLTDGRFQAAFEQSDGLCLPHFRHVLRHMTDPSRIDLLVTVQTHIWRQLKAEVESFAAKQNYEHADEVTEAEGESWVRAIAGMGGERGVFGMNRRSD
ncbi:MAG: hypothetical protein CL610_24070 [Anaerolineaceae bacterium]|nr:hypothetical protein [Anaerolineaceae bacterium]